jgi:hypothetical protein
MKLSTDGTWLGTTSWEGGAALWDMSLWIAAPNKDNDKVISSKISEPYLTLTYDAGIPNLLCSRSQTPKQILHRFLGRQIHPSSPLASEARLESWSL